MPAGDDECRVAKLADEYRQDDESCAKTARGNGSPVQFDSLHHTDLTLADVHAAQHRSTNCAGRSGRC